MTYLKLSLALQKLYPVFYIIKLTATLDSLIFGRYIQSLIIINKKRVEDRSELLGECFRDVCIK